MDAISYLTNISVILLLGLICTYISAKLKLPNILMLLLLGLGLNQIAYEGQRLFSFSEVFLTSMVILALVMVVFDGSSRFKWKDFDSLSWQSLKLVITNLLLNLIVLSILVYMLFNVDNIYYALIFASLMTATSPEVVMFMMNIPTEPKTVQLLKVEAIMNTPVIVLLPFMFLDFMKNTSNEFLMGSFISQLGPFLQQIITGIGAGVVIGILILKFMRQSYSQTLSPLILTMGALLAYVMAENLGGNGVLSVTTLGLVFGNVYVKQKGHLQEFSSLLSSFLEIIVFIMVGFLITITPNIVFIIKTIILLIAYLLIRFLALKLTFPKNEFRPLEIVFLTLNTPKGLAMATVVFMLTSLNLPNIQGITQLLALMLLYSIIISSIAVHFSKKLIQKQILE